MKTIRWGIIGCGSVTEVKSGPGFAKADNSELVAVMRRDGERAADYAARHGVARWTTNADDILNAPDIDAVYVATHPNSHHDYVLRCAAAGKPVYVEKPMATTGQESRQMIEACAAAGVPLWTAYYRRALPRFLAIKALIEDGAIGPVRGVQALRHEMLPAGGSGALPWQTDPTLSNGGLFFDGVSHLFDFLDFLFGPITAATGIADNRAGAYATEDTVAASFRFESGVLGSGFWCYASDQSLDRTTIFGATGRISFSVQYTDPIVIESGGTRRELDIADPAHVQQPLIQTIVDELNGQGKCPSTGVTGARTTWVMDQILGDFRRERLVLAESIQ